MHAPSDDPEPDAGQTPSEGTVRAYRPADGPGWIPVAEPPRTPRDQDAASPAPAPSARSLPGTRSRPGASSGPRVLPALPRWARLPTSALAGWVATVVATLVAAVERLVGLDRIRTLIFDETYYVKEAYSLAHIGYAGKWAGGSDSQFVTGNFQGLSTTGDYVVHPMTGKWLIAAGAQVFGWDNPVGWRISAVLAGTVGVFLLCRIAWNLFSSPTIVAIAGLFLATDGIDLVLSRTALLDIFLQAFVLGAFLAVVKDQQLSHPRLVGRLERWRGESGDAPGGDGLRGLGPTSGARGWLLVAGVLLGLACSVKWSGIYAIAVLGLFVVGREWTTRRRLGHPRALLSTLALEAPLAFVSLVGSALVVYVASWWSWMVHPEAWAHGRSGLPGLLGALADLWGYHVEMWNFHTHLRTPHNYQSNPWTWLLQLRPTSFAYEKVGTGCGAEQCVRNVVALGNPLMWWLAIPALVVALWAALRWGNWRIGLVLCGYAAMYLPWLMYTERTVFTFYTVAFVPFVALVLAWVLGVALDQARLRVGPDAGSSGVLDEGDRRWLGERAGRLDAAGVGADAVPGWGVPAGGVTAGGVTAGAVPAGGVPERTANTDADGQGSVTAGKPESPAAPITRESLFPRARTLRAGTTDDLRAALCVCALVIVVVVLACAAYFYPVWTGVEVPHEVWYGHMWLQRWI